MGKAFGILLIVAGIWVGLELYTEGSQRAFGGLLVDLGLSAPAATEAEAEAPLERIRDKVSGDRDLAAERRLRAMGESPDPER